MMEQEKTALKFLVLGEMCRAITSHRDLTQVLADLSPFISRLLPSHYASVVLHDDRRAVMHLHVLHSSEPIAEWVGRDFAIEDSPSGLVWQTQEVLICEDLEQEQRFERVRVLFREHGVRSLLSLPLSTSAGRLGAFTIGRSETGGFEPEDVEFAKLLAAQIAIAVENAIQHERSVSLQRELKRERDRLQLVLRLNNAVVSNLQPRSLFEALSASLRKVMEYDAASLLLPQDNNYLRVYALDFPESRGYLQTNMRVAIDGTHSGTVFRTGKGVFVGAGGLPYKDDEQSLRVCIGEGFHSHVVVPLQRNQSTVGVLVLGRRREEAFTEGDLEFATQIGQQVAIAVENALKHRALLEIKDQISEQKSYLEDEIRAGFEDIVGSSAGLRAVLDHVETVAPTDSTVLICGETGTGKELIARAIHERSSRRGRTFVKVNCAAIPLGLLESELFGHEKGAFTGAIMRKIGRFELAHQGSLFLDEVGDIPMELQPKLLRILQEQEFERLGSSQTKRVDVRLIAATNQNLTQMVVDGKFRGDLFYRLNVFPIMVPPLRERAEDIPLLVRYFANKYARRMNKRIERIPVDTIAALSRYPWPGNVRELQNFVERAVILSPGEELMAPLVELRPGAQGAGVSVKKNGNRTLRELEKEHILTALHDSNWVIGGPNGAAARLGLKRTTLLYRMDKLGIRRLESIAASRI
jgi:formate hydrogenlyase transcriptional activator